MKTRTLIASAMIGALSLGLFAAAPAIAKGGGHGARMFERHDTDGDGKISQEEFRAAHEERFKKMDLDGDGYITKEEARQAWEKMRAERGKGRGKGYGQGQGQQ